MTGCVADKSGRPLGGIAGLQSLRGAADKIAGDTGALTSGQPQIRSAAVPEHCA